MMKGLGDAAKAVATFTGIAALVGPCEGCDQRQQVLNEWFPFVRKDIMIKPASQSPTPVGQGVEYSYTSSVAFEKEGVKKVLAIQLRPYWTMTDGSAMLISEAQHFLYGRPPGVPEPSPAVAAAYAKYNAANEAAIQQLVDDLAASPPAPASVASKAVPVPGVDSKGNPIAGK